MSTACPPEACTTWSRRRAAPGIDKAEVSRIRANLDRPGPRRIVVYRLLLQPTDCCRSVPLSQSLTLCLAAFSGGMGSRFARRRSAPDRV